MSLNTPFLSFNGTDPAVSQDPTGPDSPPESPPDSNSTTPQRNYQLNQISKAVHATDNDSFNRSSFALKRTQSMGLLDSYIVQPATDIVPDNVYPHLAIADAVSLSQPCSQPSPPPSSSSPPPSSSPPSSSSLSPSPSPDLSAVHDDSVLAYEPQCHVDYLSHNWKESDISKCWRNIVSRRRDVSNSARLENASWRTWTKAKYNLKTVSPQSVNWLKDCDITWLYGPLYNQPMNIHYTDPRTDTQTNDNPTLQSDSESPAQSTTKIKSPSSASSSPLHKPILKKRTVSDRLFARQNSGQHTLPNSTSHHDHDHHDHHHNDNDNQYPPISLDSPPQNPSDQSYESGASTYLRHHNYRHRPHTGHSDEKISRQINLQYRHVPGHLLNSRNNSVVHSPASFFSRLSTPPSAPNSAPHGPTSTSAQDDIHSPVLLDYSDKSSVSSFRPLERHIHFNDRVEQCIVVDSFDDDSDSDSDSDSNTQYNPRFRRWTTFDTQDSDSENSDSSSDSEEEENEPGLFLSLCSSSSTSLHRTDRLAPLAATNTTTTKYKTIAPLPATTLRATYDDSETEERSALEASSLAYAMSHNTQPRTHIYSVYDYNSVYQAPPSSHAAQHYRDTSNQNGCGATAIAPAALLHGADPTDPTDNTPEDDAVVALPSHLSAQLAMGSNGSFIPVATQAARPQQRTQVFMMGSDSGSDSEDDCAVLRNGVQNGSQNMVGNGVQNMVHEFNTSGTHFPIADTPMPDLPDPNLRGALPSSNTNLARGPSSSPFLAGWGRS